MTQELYFCHPMLIHSVCEEELTLLPQKAIWWEKQKALLIADLHLGKGMHFRKAGLPLPLVSHQKDFAQLTELLETPNLEQVIFLGDLFHSSYNSDWELLGEILKDYQHLNFILVQGNHDILHKQHYQRFGFKVFDILHLGPFLLSHEPIEKPSAYNIYGHIHPGVKLYGKGRQKLKLPCFFFSKNHAVMPSFGKLTGLYALQPKKKDNVYVIVEDSVVKIDN